MRIIRKPPHNDQLHFQAHDITAAIHQHIFELSALAPDEAVDRLCELNAIDQARHVARPTILEDAWERGQEISIHSWIYRLDNGIINPLGEPISAPLANLG